VNHLPSKIFTNFDFSNGGKISVKWYNTTFINSKRFFLRLRVLAAKLILQIKLSGILSIKNQIAILKKGISLCAVETRSEMVQPGSSWIDRIICHKGTKTQTILFGNRST
jgi:hypothetical protein